MSNPFDLSDTTIRDLPHVKVTRHAPLGSRPCEYRKVFKPDYLGNAAYWVERENDFLLEFALKKLRHTVEFSQVSQTGMGEPVVDSVATRDAGVTLEDWLRIRPRYADGGTCDHPFQPAGMFLLLLRACLVALEEIHRLGIVHCDIKADNLCLPYTPYPLQAGELVRPDFDRLKLIDFAFSLSRERPLKHPLPIVPQAPYQSNALKTALKEDHQAGVPLHAQQVDYRVDLYSLGYLAGNILKRGLLRPEGQSGQAAVDGAKGLVARLLAFDLAEEGEERLPHTGLIRDIDALLAPLEEAGAYRVFQVGELASSQPTPTHLTPAGDDTTRVRQITPTPIVSPNAPSLPVDQAIHIPSSRHRAWLAFLPLFALAASAVAIRWLMPHGYWDWTGACGFSDESRQVRQCRLWSPGGPVLWQWAVPVAEAPPPLPRLSGENQATDAAGLLSLGVAKQQYRIGERLEIQYAVAKPLYFRLWVLDSSGRLETLYPESDGPDQPLATGQVHSLSGLMIGGPVGQDRLIALANERPLPRDGLLDKDGKLTPQAHAAKLSEARLIYSVAGR